MTTPKLTAQEAVEVLNRYAHPWVDEEGQDEIDAALAALDGMNIYASRFTTNDKVWPIYEDKMGWHVGVVRLDWDFDMLDAEWRYFPTRAEAEAECERRNKE